MPSRFKQINTSLGTSQAFSASVNPNEDWSKILDPVERKKIQNRIAQRNYRKKLKKRLKDVERSAASSSASTEQKPAELQPPQPPPCQKFSPWLSSELRCTSPGEDPMFSDRYTHGNFTSPPRSSEAFYLAPPVQHATPSAIKSPYHLIPPTATLNMFSGDHLPLLRPSNNCTPLSLVPSMNSGCFPDKDPANPFVIGYGAIGGVEIPPPHAYDLV
ncbi:hypothetical protein GQ44DRAFT_685462 [Phaeosphaeriaceae sp. PMI808]|nr:hypothetical protein GQ44DRAFT_685462 [Phaeosphaeriaceae sp. PMI808]